MGDARDKGDVNAAKRRSVLGFFFLLPLLGINAEPVDPLPSGKIELSTKEQAALPRLIQRLKQQQGDDSTDSAALLKLPTCPDAQRLEEMYTNSLQQRRGKELKGTTVQDQVSEVVYTPWGLNLHLCRALAPFPGIYRQIVIFAV